MRPNLKYTGFPKVLGAATAVTLLSLASSVSSLAAQDLFSSELDEFVVTASADASDGGLLEALPGGQVASGARSGFLGPLESLETPFTTTAFTSELIRNQQAQTVGDVLLNDPSVRVARGFGNFQRSYIIRGLPTFSDDLTFNGLYGLLPRQYLSTELFERVEVFRGATAFLNGAAPSGSSLGGTVNILPKRAGLSPYRELTTEIQTGGQRYGAFDFGQRFGDDRLGIRLNGGLRAGETAVNDEEVDIGILTLGLDWRDERLRASVDLGYQKVRREASQPNITFAPGVPILDAPDASRNLAQPWTFAEEENLFGALRAEYDVTENITAFASFGFREGTEDNSLANPTVIDDSGTTSTFRFDNSRKDSVRSGEVGLRGNFEFLGMRHRPSITANAYRQRENNAFAFSDFGGFAGSLYNPFDVAPPATDAFVGGVVGSPLRTLETEVSSIALGDMIGFFGDRFLLIGGLRYQQIEQDSFNATTGDRETSYSESAWSPSLGALYKLTDQTSVYASYIQGLERGGIAPAVVGADPVVNANEALDPIQTEQFEIGIKYEGECWGGSLNVFQSERPITGVADDLVFRELFDQRYRGVEANVFGEPNDGFRILGGISFLDTERDGLDQIGSPDYQLNFNLEYDVPFFSGLTLNGRVLHTASQFADAANMQKVDSWTRVDLGARYVWEFYDDQVVTLRARVENVADSDYYASVGGFPGQGYVTLGAPRTLAVSASYEF